MHSLHLPTDEALALLDLVSDGVYILDTRLRFLYMNRAAERISRMEREALVGQYVLDAFPALRELRFEEAFRRVLDHEGSVDFQTESPFGRSYDVHMRESSLGVLVAFKDVTEWRAREEALQVALAAEQVARISAEAAEQNNKRRQEADRFLAEAGRVLSSSLDIEATLQSVAHLAVPRLADWCAVHLVDEKTGLRQLALVHQDPERMQWACELQERYPPDLNTPRGLGRVLKTGEAQVLPRITDEMLAAIAHNKEHLELLRKVGFTSVMMVPLVSRKRVLGVISLISAELGYHYSEEDLHLAERLAHRAALAVDNSLLYHAAHEEIAERTRTEEALQLSELRYRTLTNAVSQLIWMNDAHGTPVYFNEQWEQYVGEEVVEDQPLRWLEYIHHDDWQEVLSTRAEGLAKQEAYDVRFRLRRYDNEYRWHMARVVPTTDRQGRVESWIGAAMDIHEMQMLMEQLTTRQLEVEELNEQLRRAMTETHHRVKNNLQIMAAMVDMQAMDAEDAVPVAELRRLNRHIRTLAVIHDLLTQKAHEDGRAEELSARAILEQLLPMLQQTSGARDIAFTAQDAPLSSRQGTSLALVTNELVANAMKHGNARVDVRFIVEDDKALLEVCDDGPGLPDGFDPTVRANTGLELVENLSRWDLNGRAIYSNLPEGGACVKVEFPVGNSAS